MIIFLYGENEFKIKNRLKDLKQKFIKEIDPSGNNIVEIEGNTLSIAFFIEKLQESSLFVSKKMIIVKNILHNKTKDIHQQLLNYIKEKKLEETDSIIVIIENDLKISKNEQLSKLSNNKEVPLLKKELELYSFLKKSKYSQECKSFNRVELQNIIKEEFKKANASIDNRNIDLIIDLCKSDPWRIHNELNKIINFQENNKAISSQDIKELIMEEMEENIFGLTDAISVKNKTQALNILEEQYMAQVETGYILSMLIRQFKILIQLRDALDLNYSVKQINDTIKLHPYVIQKGINQAKNFHKDQLIDIFNKFSNIEKRSRSEKINIKSEIGLIIAKI